MPTRRDVLTGALTTGAMFRARTILAKAAQPATKVSFAMPENACDSHTHIVGDPKRFPMFSGRSYTPDAAVPEEMAALHKALHIRRVVIVTPSIYGTDNAATLWGVQARGKDARGIAVIDDKTPDSELDKLAQAGFRGIRINTNIGGSNDPAAVSQRFQRSVERTQPRHWHIQMFSSLAAISGIKKLVLASPVPVVFDHFGGAQASLGVAQPGFDDLLELLRSGKAYVKISGAYRASTKGPDYPDAAPLAQALIGANADRIVWGTDWPHPDTASGKPALELSPVLQIDDGRLLSQLAVWAPDAAVRKKILVDNPARLYGF